MHWLLLVLLTFPAMARTKTVAGSRLMVCLGAQEKRFHKEKAAGAFYDLNQRMISELIQVPGIDGNPQLLKLICKKNSKTSLHLLEALLFDPKGWYVLKTSHQGQTAIAKELLRELGQSAPEILLSFLASIQMESPTPDCLEKNIPGIRTMNEEVKWLQEEVDLEKITNRKKRLAKIFAGIQKVDSFYQACAEEKAKKTDKGAGKPSDQ